MTVEFFVKTIRLTLVVAWLDACLLGSNNSRQTTATKKFIIASVNVAVWPTVLNLALR